MDRASVTVSRAGGAVAGAVNSPHSVALGVLTPTMAAHSDQNPYQAPTAPVARPPDAEAPPEIRPLASRRRRLAAFCIDAVVGYVGAYLLAVGLFLGIFASYRAVNFERPLPGPDPSFVATALAIGAAATWYFVALSYFAILESSRLQATLGKRILGIKVTDLAGRRIGWRRAWVRSFVKFLSALIYGLGFLWVFFNKRRQALHDRVAGTIVVRALPESE